MAKKPEQIGPTPSQIAEARLDASLPKAVTIPLGDIEPPTIGEVLLVKNVDPSGNVYPALVLSVTEEGAMILEVHSLIVEARRKMPNGQIVTDKQPQPHTFLLFTDETGNLEKPMQWFKRG